MFWILPFVKILDLGVSFKSLFWVNQKDIYIYTYAWNPKQQFFIGCFNWMIPILYIGNGWKSPNIHFKMVVSGTRCIHGCFQKYWYPKMDGL